MIVEPLCVTTSSSEYRSSNAGLKTCTDKFPNFAWRTRRINSSDFPENILPQITSTQPFRLIIYKDVFPFPAKLHVCIRLRVSFYSTIFLYYFRILTYIYKPINRHIKNDLSI